MSVALQNRKLFLFLNSYIVSLLVDTTFAGTPHIKNTRWSGSRAQNVWEILHYRTYHFVKPNPQIITVLA